MIFITSPAKRLDVSKSWNSNILSKVVFTSESELIANTLKKYSVEELVKKLHISQKLAELNYERYQSWDMDNDEKLKPAILAYQGDVYRALDVASLNLDSKNYLQDHLRIISGIYGVLKPYDLIQAYRLEMKIKLGETKVNNLYDYWSEKITNELNRQIEESNHRFVINLSSLEYSKAVDESVLSAPLVNIRFTQLRNGRVKSIGILNKKARGLMLKYVAQTKAKSISDIAKFNLGGYMIESQSEEELVFLSED